MNVINIFSRNQADPGPPDRGNAYREAAVELAQAICATPSILDLGEFDRHYRRALALSRIDGHPTLLHYLCGCPLDKMTDFGRDIVAKAVKIATTPHLLTGTLRFSLQQHDADNGYTPLHLAAAHAGPEICRILLEAGAKPSVLSSGGRNAAPPATPLELALSNGHDGSARLLRVWLAKRAVEQVLKQNDAENGALAAAPGASNRKGVAKS